jgi:hypothetical protein
MRPRWWDGVGGTFHTRVLGTRHFHVNLTIRSLTGSGRIAARLINSRDEELVL